MKYKTKHRDELINYLKKHKNSHLTINEIHDDLSCIPQATLYRLIDSLVEEGIVRKYIIEPNSACCYQYADCKHDHQHFHLICERCGKLIHLECDEVNHLITHINEEHSFNVDISKVNLYGVCEECQKGENK